MCVAISNAIIRRTVWHTPPIGWWPLGYMHASTHSNVVLDYRLGELIAGDRPTVIVIQISSVPLKGTPEARQGTYRVAFFHQYFGVGGVLQTSSELRYGQ